MREFLDHITGLWIFPLLHSDRKSPIRESARASVLFRRLLMVLVIVSAGLGVTTVHGQVDFEECGVFEVGFSGCVLFFPDFNFINGVEVDVPNPPLGQILRVTGTTFNCGGICFPDICLSGAQLFFDCPGSPVGESECDNGQDDDGDGLFDCCDPDCACSPGVEICDNGFDDDCDGLIDLQDSDCIGAPSGGVFIRGDSNGDGSLDVADAVNSLAFLFLGGTLGCVDSADVSDDGNVNIADPVALLNVLFSPTGGSPPPPYPDCGFDPTADNHQCWGYLACP